MQSWAVAWRRGCSCCRVCRLFREDVRHWYVPDKIYLMKIKIGLQQNNALDSCISKALKAVAMSVQPWCAHVLCCGLQYHVVPFSLLKVPGRGCTGSGPGWCSEGCTGRCELLTHLWVERHHNCRVEVMSECSGSSVCKAVLYLGTNLYITCLQAVVLGKPLKYLKSIHQCSLPHFWMLDLKSLWLVKYEHWAVSEVLSQLLLWEIRSKCIKMHKLWFVF